MSNKLNRQVEGTIKPRHTDILHLVVADVESVIKEQRRLTWTSPVQYHELDGLT